PDRDIRIRLGIYLAESHADASRAIKVLEGLSTQDVEALNGLGIAYGDAGRYADAIGAFNRVLALDPTNGLAYQNLASMVLRQGLASTVPSQRAAKVGEAEAYARKAIDVDPALADAYTTLGVALSTAGRRDEAIASWKHAFELDAAKFNALYNLWFELAQSGRRDEAVQYGRQFVATAPPAFFAPDIAPIRASLRVGPRPSGHIRAKSLWVACERTAHATRGIAETALALGLLLVQELPTRRLLVGARAGQRHYRLCCRNCDSERTPNPASREAFCD